MEVDTCTYAGGPLLGGLMDKLRVQVEGITLATNELSSIERMIQELMQKREDKLYEIEDRKAAMELTQQQINECKSASKDRMQLLQKRHNVYDSSFSLFALLPAELYVHIFKFLSPKDLCKSSMLTSKYFYEMSQADVIWSHAFKKAWGPVDDTCHICRHLAPPDKSWAGDTRKTTPQTHDKTHLIPHGKNASHWKELDGDALMVGDIVTGMEKLDVSWLSGYKHRKELESNWNSTRCSVSTLYGHTDWVTCLVVVGDMLISGSWDATIKVWDLNTKECVITLSGHTAGINAIDIKGDVLLSVSLDCTLRAWNMATKTCVSVMEGHTDQVTHVNFFTPRAPTANHNSKLPSSTPSSLYAVTGSLDGNLRVWDVTAARCLHVLEGHTTGITSMTTCHQYAASGSVDGAVMVWDCLQGRRIFTLSGHTDRVTGLQFDFATSRLVSCSWDFTARVWDLKTGNCAHVLQGHVFRIRCLSLHENTLVTGSWDSDLKIWDLKTGTCVRTLSGHTNYVWGCELQSGGKRALSSSWDKTVRVWDTHSGKLLSTLDHVSEVLCLHVNSHRIVGASKEIRIWDYCTKT